MSRSRASSSLVLIVALAALGVATPLAAQTAPAQPQAAAPRLPASAEDRAAYSRLDPLARSVF